MIKNAALILVSILVTLLASELLLRMFNIGQYELDKRVLFFSAPSLVTGKSGAVRYASDEIIREVAVYGETVDYDVVKKTNNMGFFDSIDYEVTSDITSDIAFIGDSFTAGSGGDRSWVEYLREAKKPSNINLYNLGVSGTGIHHFFELLKEVSQELSFDEVNIAIITPDIYRKHWRPYTNVNGLWFCPVDKSIDYCIEKRPHPTLFNIGIDESSGVLMNRVNEIHSLKAYRRKQDLKFYNQWSLYNLVCDAYGAVYKGDISYEYCPHLRIYRVQNFEKDRNFRNGIQKLNDIISFFPDINFRLFHLPQRNEVYNGQYNINMQQEIEATGIEYLPILQLCDWDMSMYHKHDGHPNNRGYASLAKCMGEYIY